MKLRRGRQYGASGNCRSWLDQLFFAAFALAQDCFVVAARIARVDCVPEKSCAVAMPFFGASVKYEYEGDRERSDKGIAAQSSNSRWRLRNSWAHDRQMPCARRRQYRRIPFRLPTGQHALWLQSREGRRLQGADRKGRERSGNGRMAQSQRPKEDAR